LERFVCECALRSIGERGNKPYPQEWRVREQQPPLWGQQPHAASLHHGLCLHEPCATRACSPHVPRPTKLLGEQGCIGWGACCGFAGHTVVLTLNGSHPGELHYKMAKGQCDTRGAWTSARPRAAHARASHNTQLPNQTAWRGAVWNPPHHPCVVCAVSTQHPPWRAWTCCTHTAVGPPPPRPDSVRVDIGTHVPMPPHWTR
jgi:hypothetical protein